MGLRVHDLIPEAPFLQNGFSPTQVLEAGLTTVSIPPCCIHQQALTIS